MSQHDRPPQILGRRPSPRRNRGRSARPFLPVERATHHPIAAREQAAQTAAQPVPGGAATPSGATDFGSIVTPAAIRAALARGLTQKRLAQELGVSTTTVSNWAARHGITWPTTRPRLSLAPAHLEAIRAAQAVRVISRRLIACMTRDQAHGYRICREAGLSVVESLNIIHRPDLIPLTRPAASSVAA